MTTEAKMRRPWLWPAILTLIGSAVLAADHLLLLNEDEVRLPSFLTGKGAHVDLPADWQPHEVATGFPSADEVAVTPDPSSGNWIFISRIPKSEAGAEGFTEETFVASAAWQVDEAGGRIVAGPERVIVAGVDGLETGTGGVVGRRTGELFESRLIGLFGADSSYRLMVQFDDEHQGEMLEAWDAVLSTLELRDTSVTEATPEFDQQVLTDFANSPEPFVSGGKERGNLAISEGLYRMERRISGVSVSVAPFLVPTQTVTIIVDVASAIHAPGSFGDVFGVGCVNNHDSGFIGYGTVVTESGELVVVKEAIDGRVPLSAIEESFSSPTEALQQITITCIVDSYGMAQIAVAVDGEERARLTHADPSITFYTAAQLMLGSGTDRGFIVDVAQVDAHSPNIADPT